MRAYDNIWKLAAGQGDNYTTGCLLDYPFFKEHYKLITIDLCKQQALDADVKAIQKINFTGNLNRAEGSKKFFHHRKSKRNCLRFFTRHLESIFSVVVTLNYFVFHNLFSLI